MIIIGITGTISAGKGAIVDFFKAKGFVHYSARAFLTEEMTKLGLPIQRDVMTPFANDLRRKHGAGYILESMYRKAAVVGQNAVLESVRSIGEVEFLRKMAAESIGAVVPVRFFLIAVDADQKIRYNRAVGRDSVLDRISFEKFVSNEALETTSIDPSASNLTACIALADIKIMNDGSLEELHEKLEGVCEKLLY